MFLINLQGKESIYEQIRTQIIKFIEMGILKPGEQLPSCRSLASDLGINPNTVNKAYSELEKNGYIYSVNKKGVFVSKDIKQKKLLNDNTALLMIRALKQEGYSKKDLITKINEVFKEDK